MIGSAPTPLRARLLSSLFMAAALAVGGLAAAATAAPKMTDSGAKQMAALRGIKAAKSADQKKIDSRLYLGLLHQRADSRVALLKDFRFVKPEGDGRVGVNILFASELGFKPVVEFLEAHGGVVKSKNRAKHQISARVHLADLDSLAALSEVKKVGALVPRYTNKIDTSEGDATHGADVARGLYGTTGAGVKVCVLSDGVDSLAASEASGDLPAVVDVLSGQAGSGDEGTAMLEIVHDLAPGAALGFATADPDEATFAQNILDLATGGCNIIVDDIIYLDESPFEDGPVAQAVNTVTTAGVLYFSSAGNEGNLDDGTSGTWEGDFLASAAADPAPLAGANLHDFGDGGNSLLVPGGGGNPPVLIWAEHFDTSDTGTASTDFDLYDMDGGLTTVFDASTNVQDGAGNDDVPIEFIGGGVFDGERLLIDKFAAGTTSSVPMFNLIVFRGEVDPALATNGATRGHSAAAAAFSVAATPAGASFDGISPDGPYPGQFTAANESEDFSSDGPRRILLDPTGVEITPGNRTSTGGVVRQKPDIAAADGVSTSAPTFAPFYGTSAAAPHAAAIAALIKSAVPALTPAQVRTALVSTAIDIESAGVDRDTGAGIVMPQPALASVGAVPQAVLSAGTDVPTQVIGDGDAYIESNEVWNLTLPLNNVGGDDATGISAVLSTTTPGVTINSAASTYADLAPTASGNNATPYTFTVGSSVPCGSTVNFALTVTFAGGASPQTFNYTYRLGAPGTPVTFSYSGAAVPIPDSAGADVGGTPAVADLVVAGFPGVLYSLQTSIDGSACSATVGSTTVGVEHSFVNDLQITLQSPTGTNVMLLNRIDGGGNNLCQTVLDDTAAVPVQSLATASAPFTGTFKPNALQSAFGAESANGTWHLQAQDFYTGDTGNIRAFSIVATPAICDAPPLIADMHGSKTVSGTFSSGGTVTYTVTLTDTGGLAAGDNPGNEFTDVLPASLTLVSANATSGTAVATVGTNTVTWNGTLAALTGSVTITITATVKNTVSDGDAVSNQATYSYDSDGNGTNEASGMTDDPGVGGTTDPTSFAVAQGMLTVNPPVVAFGNQLVGTPSTPLAVTLANAGSVSLTVTTVTAPTGVFSAVAGGTCANTTGPITLAGGANCTINYVFTPTATGAVPTQTLTVASAAPGGGATFDLTGTGVQGHLTIANGPAFGSQPVGTTSGVDTVTLSNTGTAPLNVTAIDTANLPFARTAGGNCPNTPSFAIAAGSNCTVTYTFSPTATGPFAQNLNVSADAPQSGGPIALSGTGTQGNLVIAPATATFPSTGVSVTSAEQTVTLSNTGTAPLTVTALDAATSPFARTVTGTCGNTPIVIANGSSCTLTYTFTPTAAVAASQVINVTTTAPGAGGFTLSGTGAQGTLTLSLPALDFGTVGIGSAQNQTLTLSNTGSSAVNVTGASAPAAPFSITGGTCTLPSFSLIPGGSCTIIYTFTPTATGPANGTSTINSDGGNGTVGLTGVGAVAAPPQAVPGLTDLGKLLLLLGLAGAGAMFVRKRVLH
jgi:uncharacterized repeat protein (TIGR01451 family)